MGTDANDSSQQWPLTHTFYEEMVFHYVFCSSQHDLLSDADDKHLAYLQTSFFFQMLDSL